MSDTQQILYNDFPARCAAAFKRRFNCDITVVNVEHDWRSDRTFVHDIDRVDAKDFTKEQRAWLDFWGGGYLAAMNIIQEVADGE